MMSTVELPPNPAAYENGGRPIRYFYDSVTEYLFEAWKQPEAEAWECESRECEACQETKPGGWLINGDPHGSYFCDDCLNRTYNESDEAEELDRRDYEDLQAAGYLSKRAADGKAKVRRLLQMVINELHRQQTEDESPGQMPWPLTEALETIFNEYFEEEPK